MNAADTKLILSDENRLHGWQRKQSLAFAATQTLVPVVLSELPAVVATCPLAFRHSTAETFELVAVQGLRPGENLQVDAQGRWRTAYIPSLNRAYPFSVDEKGEGQDATQPRLCFDHSSGLYREAPDEGKGEFRFFDDDGVLLPLLQKMQTFLLSRLANQGQTRKAVALLDQAGLIHPWDLAGQGDEPPVTSLGGLYRIDEQAMNALAAESLLQLQQFGGLAIAYAQILSTPRFRLLQHLFQLKHGKPQLPGNLNRKESIDVLFGEPEKDSLVFDWSKL